MRKNYIFNISKNYYKILLFSLQFPLNLRNLLILYKFSYQLIQKIQHLSSDAKQMMRQTDFSPSKLHMKHLCQSTLIYLLGQRSARLFNQRCKTILFYRDLSIGSISFPSDEDLHSIYFTLILKFTASSSRRDTISPGNATGNEISR